MARSKKQPSRNRKPAGSRTTKPEARLAGYEAVLDDVVDLLVGARRTAARSINAVMTATYWLIGRRIVEEEQQGRARARYGKALIERLSSDLTGQFGRGFSSSNLEQMRRFYADWPIPQTVSGESPPAPERIPQTASKESTLDTTVQTASALSPSDLATVASRFPLPWSHYVKLLSVEQPEARRFYEEEALRGGWSVRQLSRQISSQFYERTLLSKNKAAMLKRGSMPGPGDWVTSEEEIKDPYVLEFLDLKDEYSESDLERALVDKLEAFLLELGGDFAFIGRQRRLRIGDEWYRIDLLFFHRRLRCLVVIDLKLGRFTHADAGQMHFYLNYVREHWTLPEENPPVGLILCAQKDEAVARYALQVSRWRSRLSSTTRRRCERLSMTRSESGLSHSLCLRTASSHELQFKTQAFGGEVAVERKDHLDLGRSSAAELRRVALHQGRGATAFLEAVRGGHLVLGNTATGFDPRHT